MLIWCNLKGTVCVIGKMGGSHWWIWWWLGGGGGWGWGHGCILMWKDHNQETLTCSNKSIIYLRSSDTNVNNWSMLPHSDLFTVTVHSGCFPFLPIELTFFPFQDPHTWNLSSFSNKFPFKILKVYK